MGTLSTTFLKNGQKKSRREKLLPGSNAKREKLGLCILTVEDLRCDLDEHDGGHDRDEGLGQHVACVIDQAVGPSAQALVQVAPDEHAGQEAAHETQETGHERAEGHADHPVLEGAGEQLGRAQRHKGYQIVQQDFAEEVQEGRSRGRPEAQQHLQTAVDQTGEQAPLDAVAEGHQHKGQHAEQGDAAAVGHGEDADVGQHRADGDHQGAFDQNAGLGIGFRHFGFAPQYK